MRYYGFSKECFSQDWDWYSKYTVGESETEIRVDENNIPLFISEQVSAFTRYLMLNLYPVATRKEFNPFDNIANRDELFVICPHCGSYMTKTEWDEAENIYSECLECHQEINMKKS